MTESKPKAKPKFKPGNKPKPGITPSWVGRVPPLKPGNYADGLPIHEVGLNATKTGIVYRLHGNPPSAHE